MRRGRLSTRRGNSAIMVASAGRERSASSGIGVVCAPNGSSGTMQR